MLHDISMITSMVHVMFSLALESVFHAVLYGSWFGLALLRCIPMVAIISTNEN
jgi:vacuolar-type H+-ATPase subunit I/STV1